MTLIRAQRENLYIYLLSLIFSSVLWIARDVPSIIHLINTEGVSDLSRYYQFYQNNTWATLLTIEWNKGKLFYSIFYFFKSIGLSFELFLFIVLNLFYIVFAELVKSFFNTKSVYIIFLVYLVLTFWLNSAVLVALRQGVAMLLIALALRIFDRDQSIFLKVFILFLISGIHFSVVIFFPLILLLNFFKKKELFLEIAFYIALILYVFDLWNLIGREIILFLLDKGLYLGALEKINSSSSYVVGFSVYKMMAFLIPIVLFRVPLYLGYYRYVGAKLVYIIFLYISIIGMIFSGLPYHDRLFLYAWIFSPILLIGLFAFVHRKNSGYS